MTQIFKQGIFILICVHYYCLCYNNFNELKQDMQLRVMRIADAAQTIYQDICTVDSFDCPVQSFNTCDGTDQRTCIEQFPLAKDCTGVSEYSMTSIIRIPNSVASFNLTNEMEFFICRSARPQFESVMQQLLIQDKKHYSWIAFGSNVGVSRICPGFKFEKQNATESCGDFDPRLRPWYSSTIYAPKKMIIIIQNSKGIYEQPNRFTSMQNSLAAILQTASHEDLFNVIQFSDTPRLFFNSNTSKLVSLSALKAQYKNKTNNLGLFYQDLVNNITKSKSTVNNYIAALQLALEVFGNSQSINPQMEHFIMFFTGFAPTNYTVNYSAQMDAMLAAKEQQLSTDFYFFGFGVTLHDQRAVKILSSIACKYDGIYTDINDVIYESVFLDQAAGYYDYLTQGNAMSGTKWSDIYVDALGLGDMVSVIKPAYRQENNVTILIGVGSLDILVSQITLFLNLNNITNNLLKTQLPFKKNVSICALQSIRRNYRCHKPQTIGCSQHTFCAPPMLPSNQNVIRTPVDTSNNDCCIAQVQNYTGVIVGVVVGVVGGILVVAIIVYCLIFRKRKKANLQQTYAEIFAQFHDFDKTRIRSESEISIINS